MAAQFDSVVMLTWSDWKTEPRSNRYHYATRFARRVPVFFVQPDRAAAMEEATENPNIVLLHVGAAYDRGQLARVKQTLAARRLSRPLIWSYNPFYRGLTQLFPESIRVHHATEDYFSLQHYLHPAGWRARFRDRYHRRKLQYRLVLALRDADLVVCVTPGVAEAIRQFCGRDIPVLVLQNGCDYGFWSERTAQAVGTSGTIAIYQGSINARLDVELLSDVMRRLPHWEFRFCGPVSASFHAWKSVSEQPNYRYLGMLRPEALARALQEADVGLIPFIDYPGLSEQSLPLKAFEYAACGLPVVSTPIRALADFPSVFRFENTAARFATAIVEASARRHDPAQLAVRRRIAQQQDYDRRFDDLLNELARLGRRRRSRELRALSQAARFAIASWWNGALALAGKRLPY